MHIFIPSSRKWHVRKILLDMLATTVSDNQANWEQCIRKVCFAYTSVHSSTRFTPFFLMFGRQAKLPIDLMYGSSPQEVIPPVGKYVQNLAECLCTCKRKVAG